MAAPSDLSVAYETEAKAGDGGVEYQVIVVNPEKHGQGIGAYLTYELRTRMKGGAFGEREFAVRRKYNDFIWLRNVLAADYPHFLVPVLAEKEKLPAQASHEEQVIRRRCEQLQSFMNRVCNHHVLSQSKDLLLFLETKVWALESTQAAYSNQSEDEVAGVLAEAAKSFRASSDRVKQQAGADELYFVERLRDLVLWSTAAKELLKNREAAMCDVVALRESKMKIEREFEQVKQNMQSTKPKTAMEIFKETLTLESPKEQIRKLEEQKKECEAASVKAEGRWKQATKVTSQEMQRFHNLRVWEVRETLRGFCESQIQFHEDMARTWQSLLPKVTRPHCSPLLPSLLSSSPLTAVLVSPHCSPAHPSLLYSSSKRFLSTTWKAGHR
ncbi:hypothetical protein GUITHDRAFT_68216 [Guillardia theta CCMP2712]|uniref:PX domain-containing protein n=1 Tax=Guillardia theta (strain CCMP2712) TaxID=905079 RepID=L1JLM2_GUITC|nr:hypothetical protein GUITHDRAFT_68216 [Guillardia theta CCMP2712]EKX49074.1 hypothetical protein GUITHDRAFT_68216 [Guillardia theta CCMP2712]|eukprot:XP_005836054.1 hypothetical protein GUITHDRAFT_68216 [Guillardia theta CCMP2712]